MKKLIFIVPFVFLLLILGKGNCYSQISPPPLVVSENFAVFNKTQCTTQVTMNCSDGTSTTETMSADDAYYGVCPTDEFLCYIEIVFPNMDVITTTLNDGESGTPDCFNPGENTPSNSCYSSIDWKAIQPSGYITCNFY